MIFKALFSKIWAWLIALVGVAISVLVVVVRRTQKENSRLRVHVENAEAKVNRARVVSKRDIELIQNEQVREVEIIKDLERGRRDYDPNELFNKNNDDS